MTARGKCVGTRNDLLPKTYHLKHVALDKCGCRYNWHFFIEAETFLLPRLNHVKHVLTLNVVFLTFMLLPCTYSTSCDSERSVVRTHKWEQFVLDEPFFLSVPCLRYHRSV